jgi:hypothetical protein
MQTITNLPFEKKLAVLGAAAVVSYVKPDFAAYYSLAALASCAYKVLFTKPEFKERVVLGLAVGYGSGDTPEKAHQNAYKDANRQLGQVVSVSVKAQLALEAVKAQLALEAARAKNISGKESPQGVQDIPLKRE